MQVGILGPVEVRGEHGESSPLGGPRQRAVLASLALRAGRTVTSDRLITDVWGDDLPGAPTRTLTTVISRLRTALGDPDVVASDGGGYRLAVDPQAIDLHRAERLIERGRERLAAGDAVDAGETLREALALWRGEPLDDIGDVPLRAWARPRLEELHLRAVTARLEADLATGEADRLAGELVGLRSDHPLHEGLASLQMRVLVAAGRRSDALAVYEQTRERLADELGIDPGGELTRVHLAVLREQPTVAEPGGSDSGPGTATHRREGGPTLPLPHLAPSSTHPYVGRAELLEQLRSAWTSVVSDGGARCVLLVGEPGVGKTRTAAELADTVHAKGGMVLCGRCDEGLSAPYQPFVEALDWQTTHDPTRPLGRLPGELTRLLGDLPRRVAGLPEPVVSDPHVAQHRLFEAVTSWLAGLSRTDGLLLIVDDLQWASPQTLQLLQHVVRGVAADPDAHVLVVTTYRDTEVADDHPLAATLAQLRRLAPVDELLMAGLSADETHELIEQMAGHDLDHDAVVRLVHAPTRGNPFFATELLSHLVESGTVQLRDGRWEVVSDASVDVPAGVRDVVGRRLARLSTTTHEVLRYAALMVGDVEVMVLRELTEGELDAVLDAVDEALAARLLESSPPDAVRFTHGLVRATIAGQLSPTRRGRMHGRIADALEVARPSAIGALAHHAGLAAPIDGGWQRAIAHTIAAGEQALRGGAAQDARHGFAQAIHLLDAAPHADERSALRARCGLGEAQRDQGDGASRDTLLTVGWDALRAGHLDLAARAVIGNSRMTMSVAGAVDADRLELLEEVLARDDDAPRQRARLQALVSAESSFIRGSCQRRLALADEALAIARGLDDPALEAWVSITTTMSTSIPARAEDLLARNARATVLADTSGDPALRCMARFMEGVARLVVGEVRATERLAGDAADLADAEAPPYLQWMTRSFKVQFLAYRGDFAGARERNAEVLRFGQAIGEPDAVNWWGGIEAVLAYLDGSYPLLADTFGEFADTYDEHIAWRASQVLALAQAGRDQEAHRILAAHGLDDPRGVPEDAFQLVTLELLAGIAFELELADLGEDTLPLLRPHARLLTTIGQGCTQPVEYGIGLAAAAAGRWQEAIEAMARCRQRLVTLDLRSHVPSAALQSARILLRRGGADDLVEAGRIATQGLVAAGELGTAPVQERLEELLERVA